MVVVGYEALARMPVTPQKGPDWWLDAADQCGLRIPLELACLRAAAALGPPPDGRSLFVNASPSTVTDPATLALRDELPEYLVIELTEQEAVDDYDGLRACLAGWLDRGVRLALDDAGAGYSSLRHVVELSPDYLKLDRELVTTIDQDPNRRALMRAIVAFAREIGTSVIAEGVETRGELEVLREAEVHLVQGYLLARPGPAWPTIGQRGSTTSGFIDLIDDDGPQTENGGAELHQALAAVENVLEAGEIVVESLFRRGDLMPSLYLERNGELRCVAQRGLWHVLDGLPATAGITGRTWASGQAVVVPDVALNSDYLEAIPGVVSEMCVPIMVNGDAVGTLNVESLLPLTSDAVASTEAVAQLLSERLSIIGTNLGNSRWQRAAHASVAISGLRANRRLPQQVLHRFLAAAEMDSACLLVGEATGPRALTAVGPLSDSLMKLSDSELEALSTLVGDVRSCYTAGDASSRGFVGSESLRTAGARAVLVLPLWVQRERFGTLVVAHSRPMRLTGDQVEPLELLADHAAAVLGSML
jgi:EAL domain-containing protein (putative c-di-GMP-specific phosphodiesterase class I)/putative methionine-R-sulfoxide reductase with GAF domain